MGLSHAKGVATEAAKLARADLATSTVMEMTALAGTMGRCAGVALGWLTVLVGWLVDSVG